MTTTWMMWYENDKGKSLTRRIQEATDWHKNKYGTEPVRCEVNIAENIKDYTGNLVVTAKRNVLPNHYFLSAE